MITTAFWMVFSIIIFIMLVLDLGLFSRKSHTVGFKEAVIWSLIWIGLALLFAGGIYWKLGLEPSLLFTTGYLVELSLSVDNLFVFLLVFSSFQIPSQYQHKTLFWGILGAIVLRGLFIAAGITLINQFHWIIYVFGLFLIYTGFKIGFQKEKNDDPTQQPLIRFLKKFLPISPALSGNHFFVKVAGKWLATPLFIVLLTIEVMDVVFALDSIPTILAITTDPFLVITSNIFAIIGLRAMFFALARFKEIFHYLNQGLAVILVLIGSKMLLSRFFHVPAPAALGMIVLVLALSILASLRWPKER